jgi:hypothetical protein
MMMHGVADQLALLLRGSPVGVRRSRCPWLSRSQPGGARKVADEIIDSPQPILCISAMLPVLLYK